MIYQKVPKRGIVPKELTGQPMTPEEAWCKMIHWENQPFESLGYEYNNEMYSYEVIDE